MGKREKNKKTVSFIIINVPTEIEYEAPVSLVRGSKVIFSALLGTVTL